MTPLDPTITAEPETTSIRPGEVYLSVDPGVARDASLAFIGRVSSPWTERSQCPKNMARAREAGLPAEIVIDAPFRPALQGLEAGRWIHVLTWLGEARRDLAVQRPRHSKEARGTFALRSPVRPNPIGLHLVEITAIDMATGCLAIAGIDVLDGTAVLDIKPFFETVDVPPLPDTSAASGG